MHYPPAHLGPLGLGIAISPDIADDFMVVEQIEICMIKYYDSWEPMGPRIMVTGWSYSILEEFSQD
jgi:hypothetical protein